MFFADVAQAPLRRISASLLILLTACSSPDEPSTSVSNVAPQFVGSAACESCHERESSLWRRSHHAQAMQVATQATVLGDFSGASFERYSTTSRFFTRDDGFYVATDNADGETQEFRIAYTFGVEPLQQYLIEFDGGRLQTLPLAWDMRASEAGGQRWFHIYPDEAIRNDDVLHWTGREQNWNFMCAECHSTNLEKNYRAEDDTYTTAWSEINVGCEACHGPASRHITQAGSGDFDYQSGLLVDLDDSGRAVWEMNAGTGIASRSELRARIPAQPEACGRCHARRSVQREDYAYGQPLADTHLPVLLEDGLYFADGQVREEVYVYGSFLQSRMYQAGVSCSDCHDPHSGSLRAATKTSDVCSTCHLPQRFDTTEHHHHEADVVACVDCHMPTREYMVVDPRRDHSFRVPRPDLTVATGAPNACNSCHTDRDAEWASVATKEWYGPREADHFGFALHAARTGAGDANSLLTAVISNDVHPGIARATALSELRAPLSRDAVQTIDRNLQSGDSLIRIGALRALSGLPDRQRLTAAIPLLSDALLAVRIEAAGLVSPIRSLLPPQFSNAFVAAEREMIDALQSNIERPEAMASLASVEIDRGDVVSAEAWLDKALRIEPLFSPGRVNLADLYRQTGRDDEAEVRLREGLALTPDAAAFHHSLGLLLVRTQRQEDGLDALQQATQLDRNNARFVYVYAVALNSLGQPDAAISSLRDAQLRFASDFDIGWALATMLRDQGRTDEARASAAALLAQHPEVEVVRNLLQSL